MSDFAESSNNAPNAADWPTMETANGEPARTGDGAVDRPVDRLDPLHVVMVFLVVAVLAGGCLLLSAAESETLVDGARAWAEESVLRAVVQLLCLNYSAATYYPGDVKNYILGVGAGLAVLAFTVSVLSRTRGGHDAAGTSRLANGAVRPRLTSPAVSQILVVMFLLWSFASSRWARAPSLSTGASTLVAIQFLWALAVAVSLNHTAARTVIRLLVGVLGLTGAIAVWYYYVRNPVLAAKFPFGNPIFLATCLLAGLIPALVFAGELLWESARPGSTGKAFRFVALLVALVCCFWAFCLAGSRGPSVGLLSGILAVVFFSVRGWRKWIPVLLGICLCVGGWLYFSSQANAFSPTGRGATIRFRLAAWEVAWGMFTQKPLTGHGQGGFVLTGDTRIGERVLADPLPFTARLSHVHNEWLETLCDLGVVGLTLIVAALIFAFHAGVSRIRSSTDRRTAAALVAVLSALVAVCVEECFGVGLRVSGVATIFFTLLGLMWTLSDRPERNVVAICARSSCRRMATGVVGGLVGLVAVAASQQDFSAARSAYRAGELLAQGKTEEAVESAAGGLLRLNPVRVLGNRARLAETHVLLAEKYADRGVDRDRRAAESDPPEARLTALATEDYRLADEHVRLASVHLKELVSCAPRWIGAGRLEFRVNLVRAHMAAAKGEPSASDAMLKNAAAALEREMVRLPFDPSLATDYLRVALDWLSAQDAIGVLARPLRHNRLDGDYVRVLDYLRSTADFDEAIASIAARAAGAGAADAVLWTPEKLRIAAAAFWLQGRYSKAVELLRVAADMYEPLTTAAPLGASACYAELADALFFSDILHPDPAIRTARESIRMAPQSQQGRALRFAVEERLIQYLLAADNETGAVDLLRTHAPAGASETDVTAELGRRLRLLLEAMRGGYQETLRANQPGGEIGETYRKWLVRGLELNRADPGLYFLAAELALRDQDGAMAARDLEAAVRYGLPLEEALRFLDAEAGAFPASEALQQLRAKLNAALQQSGSPPARSQPDRTGRAQRAPSPTPTGGEEAP